MTAIKRYLVGGSVRDALLNIPSKDLDYAVEAPSFQDMREWLVSEGHTIFQEREEYGVIRSRLGKEAADHTLCRKDGPYSDGRRPDYTLPGTLMDDLARRDLTINALAQDPVTGDIIDPWNGQEDLANRVLRAVGDPEERMQEDALRAFRAFRFAVTKGFTIEEELDFALRKVRTLDLMENVATDRIRDELHRMFKHDSVGSMLLFVQQYPMYLGIIEARGIWFEPTSREK